MLLFELVRFRFQNGCRRKEISKFSAPVGRGGGREGHSALSWQRAGSIKSSKMKQMERKTKQKREKRGRSHQQASADWSSAKNAKLNGKKWDRWRQTSRDAASSPLIGRWGGGQAIGFWWWPARRNSWLQRSRPITAHNFGVVQFKQKKKI